MVYYGRAADPVTGEAYRVPDGARNHRPLGEAPAPATDVRPGDLKKLRDDLDAAGPGGRTRTQISTTLFRHCTAREIDALLNQLAAGGSGRYRTWELLSGTRWVVYYGRAADPVTGEAYGVPDGARNHRRLGEAPAPATGVQPGDLKKLGDDLDAAGPGGRTRTHINTTLFSHGRTAGDVDALLTQLAADGPGRYRTWEQLSGKQWVVYYGRRRGDRGGRSGRGPGPPATR